MNAHPAKPVIGAPSGEKDYGLNCRQAETIAGLEALPFALLDRAFKRES